jgi:hypothetical protein
MAEADTMLLDRVTRCYPHSAQPGARAGGPNTLAAPAAERCGHGVHPFTMAGMMW